MTLTAILAALGALLLLPLAWTRVQVFRAGRRHPPAGRIVPAAGRRVHVVDIPGEGGDDGPPLLFVHGALTNLEDLRQSLSAHLAGHRRLFVDRPGLGWSERLPGDDKPTPQAAAIAAALAALDVPPAVVVGHSYGAAVALALALDHPERVVGLVLLSPATHPWPGGVGRTYHLLSRPVLGPLIAHMLAVPVGDATRTGGIARTFLPAAPPPGYVARTALALNYRPRDIRNNARDIVALDGAARVLAPRYPTVRAPVLVVTADRDAVVSPWIHAEALHRSLPSVDRLVLADGGHNLHHGRAAEVADAVEGFLARLPRPAAKVPDRAARGAAGA